MTIEGGIENIEYILLFSISLGISKIFNVKKYLSQTQTSQSWNHKISDNMWSSFKAEEANIIAKRTINVTNKYQKIKMGAIEF